MFDSSTETANSVISNQSKTRQLVDDVGIVEGQIFQESFEIARRVVRFPIDLTEKEVAEQVEKRSKLLLLLDLKPFAPTSEKAFEDWVDAAAVQISSQRLCVAVFRDAWVAVAPPLMATKIRAANISGTHEELVNDVAQRIRYRLTYVQELEEDVYKPRRAAAVWEARERVENLVARLYRLCQRWKYPFVISSPRLRTLALRSLPQVLEQDILKITESLDWEALWLRAEGQEAWMLEQCGGRLPEPMHVFVAEKRTREGDEDINMQTNRWSQRGGPPRKAMKCKCCGSDEHYTKDCPKSHWRCRSCQLVGHIASVCPNVAFKDARGRVETRVEAKPSKTTLTQRKDRTQEERLTSAQATIQAITDQARQRGRVAADRRREKTKDVPKKRKAVDHPEGIAEEHREEDAYEETSDDEEDAYEKVVQRVCTAIIPQKSSVMRVSAIVNGISHDVVVDTGASKSLCSREDAQNLRLLDQSRSPVKFSGLGDLLGFPCEPVKVNIGNQETDVSFWVVDKPGLPTLMGYADIQRMDLILRPKTGELLLGEKLIPVAVACPVEVEQRDVKLDVITQKPLGATPDELYEDGKKTLFKMMDHLPKEVQDKVWKVFDTYRDVWLEPKVGGAVKYAAKFTVEGAPIKMKFRRMAPELLLELNSQLDMMLKAGVIQPSKSPWGAVPVFIKKPDKTWRLCLDYRKLNTKMTSDVYPLPLLWDQVQRAAGYKFYTLIDLNWGFWNLPVHPESKKYTALVTPRGLFEFNVLPFGIKNSPSEFQRLMDTVLDSIRHKNVTWYIDDIVIYGNTYDEVTSLITEVFQLLKENEMYIKLTKVRIMQAQALVLGHVVSREGILPNPQKVQGLLDAKPPKNLRELRGFLGSVNFLRRFIPNCASITAPLVKLTRKSVRFNFDDECEESFRLLKTALAENTMLVAPAGKGQFVIICDASDKGLGAVLLQHQDNQLPVLEFASRVLTPAERNWPAYEREAFAIRWAVARFEDYIQVAGALVMTDHQSLTWLENASRGKVRRWALYLQQFNLKIVHINGVDNVLADWLSRSVEEGDEFNDDEEIVAPQYVALEKNPGETRTYLRQNDLTVPAVPTMKELKKLNADLGDEEIPSTYVGNEGIRYSVKTHKPYIPENAREQFIYWMHASRFGGHAGINRTVKRLAKWVWWPNMHNDVAKYIKGCLICVRSRPVIPVVSVKSVLSKAYPFELISLDCVGPRMWWNKNVYYLVIIDHASRYVYARATSNPPTSAWIIEVFRDSWLMLFQSPVALLTDRGSEFLSYEFKDFLARDVGCVVVKTSPYYPQGNAINESCHRALNGMITALESSMDLTFEEAIRYIVQIHNSAPHTATGHSPYFYLFGMEPTLPGWQGLQSQDKERVSRHAKVSEAQTQHLVKLKLEAEGVQARKMVDLPMIGGWIVYPLSDYEKRVAEGSTSKYSSDWSLPAKVLKVQGKTVVVRTWQGSDRQVPVAQVFKLEGEVAPSLQLVNVKQLEYERPTLSKATSHEAKSLAWPDFLESAQTESKTANKVISGRNKRGRFVAE